MTEATQAPLRPLADTSPSAIVAGFIAMMTGYTSSLVLMFEISPRDSEFMLVSELVMTFRLLQLRMCHGGCGRSWRRSWNSDLYWRISIH